jgi:hypothetical protein
MMADAPVIHIGENSPEWVAYRLFGDIRGAENRSKADRKYILDTYAECLATVRAPNDRLRDK